MRLRSLAFLAAAAASLLLAAWSECHGLSFQNEPDGFNGISWGTPVDSLRSMEYKGKKEGAPDISVYRRAGEELIYGRARLASIEYGFVMGRLGLVTLRVNTLYQYLLMKEEAFRMFGKGKELDPVSERYVWEGKRTKILLISAFDMS